MSRTDKQLAAGQRRTLRAMREKLLAMASEWDDRDMFNLAAFEYLADQCDEVGKTLITDSPSEGETST